MTKPDSSGADKAQSGVTLSFPGEADGGIERLLAEYPRADIEPLVDDGAVRFGVHFDPSPDCSEARSVPARTSLGYPVTCVCGDLTGAWVKLPNGEFACEVDVSEVLNSMLRTVGSGDGKA